MELNYEQVEEILKGYKELQEFHQSAVEQFVASVDRMISLTKEFEELFNPIEVVKEPICFSCGQPIVDGEPSIFTDVLRHAVCYASESI